MGNNPSSTSKPATPALSSSTSGPESPKHTKRDSKNFPIHGPHGVAAPPEPSLAQAQGSTVHRHAKSLGSITGSSLTGSSPSSSSNSSATAKPIPRDAPPSKPVDVPLSHTESPSLRSQGHGDYGHQPQHHLPQPQYGAHVVEAPLASHGSINDMSYLTRPPRLPLPIEEEIHTPGSPIIAPADIGTVLEQDMEVPDLDGTAGRPSVESLDGEELEALRVDKTSPKIPTRIEWTGGGQKVYVTGTPFHWNKKQRLPPV